MQFNDRSKYFIITIDTEGDNLWNWKEGEIISTENSLYLKRFQSLCEKYGFKPVWLSNYEMMNDPRYIEFILDVVKRKTGECGMHLHAWNTPPYFSLPKEQNGLPYLIEYPDEIICKKIDFLVDFIEQRTGKKPVSHRAGRWATNDKYLEYLSKSGFFIDCSYTPFINWESSCGRTKNSKGSNYFEVNPRPHRLFNQLYEVPVTTVFTHRFFWPEKPTFKNIMRQLYYSFRGRTIWLRPNGDNLRQMKWIIKKGIKSNYVMFMLHSSEFMPGGSPTFKDEKAIDKLFRDLEKLFSYASKTFVGITLEDFYSNCIKEKDS